MMKDDFYLTLPSHSSLQEFPQNANNNFKVCLPKVIRLDEGDWKVALASILLPDPKNVLPSWLTDYVVLFTRLIILKRITQQIKLVLKPRRYCDYDLIKTTVLCKSNANEICRKSSFVLANFP